MSTFYERTLFILLITLATAGTGFAQMRAHVGLDASQIRMSDLQRLDRQYLAPVQQAIDFMAPAASNVMRAQDDQHVGLGLAYGSEIEKLGLQLSYYYFLSAVLAVGGDFTYFFPESATVAGVKTTLSFYELNVMAHYLLYTAATLRAYALAGLNFAIFGFKTSGSGLSFSDSSSEIGLNLGGGLEFALAAGLLYLELRYVLGDADQLVAAAGYRITLGR